MKAFFIVSCIFCSLIFLILLSSDIDVFPPESAGNVNSDIAHLAVLPADCSARNLVIDVMKFR